MSNIQNPAEIRLYQVGGSVRDEFLGINSKDIDYAVEAPSYEAMKAYLQANDYNIFLEQQQYLTIRAKFPSNHPHRQIWGIHVADFVLCRTETGYSDGRRPDQVLPGTIYEDLSRRDFTVNAMAKAEDGTLLDPYNGRSDLEQGILRCVGSAQDRMREDALRSLRALRFMVTKGLKPDAELESVLVSDWLPEFMATLPAERIRQELRQAMMHDTFRTIELLHAYPPAFRQMIFRELWLEPTNKKPKNQKKIKA